MRATVVLIVGLGSGLLGAVAAAAAPQPPAPPKPSIEGKYTLITAGSTKSGAWGAAGPAGANGLLTARAAAAAREAVVTKDRITIDGRTVWEYTLDGAAKPMKIDVTVVPLRGKGAKLIGIAEVAGDRLTLALTDAEGFRPKDFDPADGVSHYYFQKAPPPPRWEYKIVALTPGREEFVEKEVNRLADEGYEIAHTAASGTASHLVLKRQKP